MSRSCTSIFTAVLFTMAKRWVQPRSLSKDEPAVNIGECYACDGILFSLHMKEILSQVITGMELEDIKLSEKAMQR